MAPRYTDQAALDAREDNILDGALDIISKQGIVGLTMDKLVAGISYSKGTLYNHFSSKEDVLAGLCNRNMHSVMNLFLRAAAIKESTRDKMTAIGFAYLVSVLLSPQHFALVMNAKTELFEKASPKRREEHDQLDEKLFGVMHGIIQEAISKKELILTSNVDAQQVSFSTWAMAFGTIGLLLNGEKACSTMTGMILEDRVIAHSNIVMDGLGWKASGRGQKEFIAWLKSDVFSDEIDVLEQQDIYLRTA
ncbi:MAG: AcrR family transcriptional regulator [Cellvibrionaceae bacterium]|jgi:AcrR family transcriptional regulator